MSLESNIAETGGAERVVAEMITGGVEVRVDPRGDSGVVRDDVDELCVERWWSAQGRCSL